MDFNQTILVITLLGITTQIGLIIRKIIDEKSIRKKMAKAKDLFPSSTIDQVESFIKNTKSRFL